MKPSIRLGPANPVIARLAEEGQHTSIYYKNEIHECWSRISKHILSGFGAGGRRGARGALAPPVKNAVKNLIKVFGCIICKYFEQLWGLITFFWLFTSQLTQLGQHTTEHLYWHEIPIYQLNSEFTTKLRGRPGVMGKK